MNCLTQIVNIVELIIKLFNETNGTNFLGLDLYRSMF